MKLPPENDSREQDERGDANGEPAPFEVACATVRRHRAGLPRRLRASAKGQGFRGAQKRCGLAVRKRPASSAACVSAMTTAAISKRRRMDRRSAAAEMREARLLG